MERCWWTNYRTGEYFVLFHNTDVLLELRVFP
jgi:hypothetical protein